MTERLATLLHAEAEALEVPTPPTTAIVTAGRGIRRRRRIGKGVVACLAVTVACAGVLAVRADEAAESARFTSSGYQGQGALAVDRELYVGGVHIPFAEAVKSFYYTADGVVVRSGSSPWTDDPDVDHYTLVLPDGSKKQLDLETNDRVVATEPDSNRLAYADPNGDRWDVVVVDLESGDELSRSTIEGTKWGGWEAPPVALDGPRVWAHFEDGWTEVDWRTGDSRLVPDTHNVFEIANGVYAQQGDDAWTVRRMADRSVVRTISMATDMYAFFSPDGRYLRVWDQDFGRPRSQPVAPYILDVETGRTSELTGESWTYGWTPTGSLLKVDRDGAVQTCPPLGGACTATDLRVDPQAETLKLGGNSYES